MCNLNISQFPMEPHLPCGSICALENCFDTFDESLGIFIKKGGNCGNQSPSDSPGAFLAEGAIFSPFAAKYKRGVHAATLDFTG